MPATTIGLDLAKSLFQVHGVDTHGKVVVTKRLRRDAVLGAQSGENEQAVRSKLNSAYGGNRTGRTAA